jgi:hypothetical protein
MREKIKEVYLLKSDGERLRKFCRGCQYFRPEKPVRDICSVVGWYNTRNIQDVIDYVKYCPCNKKCLVKASCREEQCPIWLDFIHAAVEERNEKLMRKK